VVVGTRTQAILEHEEMLVDYGDSFVLQSGAAPDAGA